MPACAVDPRPPDGLRKPGWVASLGVAIGQPTARGIDDLEPARNPPKGRRRLVWSGAPTVRLSVTQNVPTYSVYVSYEASKLVR